MRPLNLPAALRLVKKWECLGFPYPRTSEGVTALADEFMKIVGDDVDRAEWLSSCVLAGCPRCPTPIELRRIMARKYPPADGLSASDVDFTDLMSGTGRKGE